MKLIKFKKLTAVMISVVCLFTFSQSAFANDGIADSQQTALAFCPGCSAYLYMEKINSPGDVEWYVFHNTSSTWRGATVYLYQASSALNYDLWGMISHNNTNYPMFYATDNGPGLADALYADVPPGGSLYVMVKGRSYSDYSSVSPYTIKIQ